MRRIDLRPYQTTERDKDTGHLIPFDVLGSFIELFFIEPTMPSRERLRRDDLCRRIELGGDDALIEDSDWDIVRVALNQAQMVGRVYAEFTRRIVEAQAVEVEERPLTAVQGGRT